MTRSEGARAFLALPLSSELARRVAGEVGDALGYGATQDWKLPHAEGLHLTLYFLGDRARAGLERLAAEVGPALAACAPPRLALSGAGAFPSLERPRVLWIGVRERAEVGRLAAVRSALLAALARAGEDTRAEAAKPYLAHVTVARPRTPRARVPEAFVRLSLAQPFETPEAVLFDSVSAAGGNRYEPRARFPFAASSPGPG